MKTTSVVSCPNCNGFGSVELRVDRYGMGISGGRCYRCDGSCFIEVTREVPDAPPDIPQIIPGAIP